MSVLLGVTFREYEYILPAKLLLPGAVEPPPLTVTGTASAPASAATATADDISSAVDRLNRVFGLMLGNRRCE